MAGSVFGRGFERDISKAARQAWQRAHAHAGNSARRADFDCAGCRPLGNGDLSDNVRSRRRDRDFHTRGTRWTLGAGEVLCEFEWTEVMSTDYADYADYTDYT